MEKGRGNGMDTLQTDKVFARKEYIEREAAIKAVCDSSAHTCELKNCFHGCQEAQAILAIPAADVVPVRHGEWQRVLGQPHIMKCSSCGSTSAAGNFNYCPNCGALMDKDGDGNG